MTSRSTRRTTEEARRIILEVATALLANKSYELPGLERLAEQAGVHKMTIYRAFGSREGLARACAEWLCKQEAALWTQTVKNCLDATGCRIRVLFTIVADRLLRETPTECRLHMLAPHFGDASDDVCSTLEERRRNLYDLLLELTKISAAKESTALADALYLVWEGAVVPIRSEAERVRLARNLPVVVDRLLKAYSI
ncbi:TetR/AcrR family transcriptional regulator [Paraburkholderia phytofirmans]|nr:TetR/AcrR family transcriptional regulator [Paraburkholderia phytofirmans]